MNQTAFLNIDLDIASREDLSQLVAEFGEHAIIMRNDVVKGVYIASFETHKSEENEIIAAYKAIVDGLSPSAKALWDNCHKKTFDFGFESGASPRNFQSVISAASITALHALGGEVVLTIYAPMPRQKE